MRTNKEKTAVRRDRQTERERMRERERKQANVNQELSSGATPPYAQPTRPVVGTNRLTTHGTAGVDATRPHVGLVGVADAVVERDEEGGGGAEQAQHQQQHHNDLKGRRGIRYLNQLRNHWIGNEMKRIVLLFCAGFVRGWGVVEYVYIPMYVQIHTHTRACFEVIYFKYIFLCFLFSNFVYAVALNATLLVKHSIT